MPEIVIDFTPIIDYLVYVSTLPFHLIIWELIRKGGWILIMYPIVVGLKNIHLFRMAGKYASNQTYIFLAIDIPKNNEQTPKAFENIFNQLAGAHSDPWWWDRYVEGEFQQGFSLEIVSIEGHIQFIIALNTKHRDLIESAIFAQYPEAEITEVEDYTKEFDKPVPNDEFDVWGTEFIHVKNHVYPIKVYRSFGDELNQEYKDPMAAFLENMTRIGPGEHIWFQVILTPIGQDWADDGKKEIDRMLGKKAKSKDGIIDKMIKLPISLITHFADAIFGGEASAKAEEPKSKSLQELPPGDVQVIKSIQEKCSKIGHKVKVRLLYVAKHEVFNKGKVAYAMVGAMKQFNTQDLNSVKPDYKKIGTGGDFFFSHRKRDVISRRKKTILWAYKNRIASVGAAQMILNSEELASIYHFPLFTVKAAMLKKIDLKTAEPPSNLPDLGQQEIFDVQNRAIDEATEEVSSKPTTKKEQEPVEISFDDDYFENRFGKGKTKKAPKPVEDDITSEPDKSPTLEQAKVGTYKKVSMKTQANVNIVAPPTLKQKKEDNPNDPPVTGGPPPNLPI